MRRFALAFKYSFDYYSRVPAPERLLKDRLYGQLARVAKALASPRRLELLEVLAQHPRTVEDLAGRIGQSVAATSHHLKGLREARLVEAVREAQFIRYRVADPMVLALLGALRQTANVRLLEVEAITRDLLGDDEPMTELSREELLAGVASGRTVLLDVRPEDEFRHGHLEGARNIPLAELPARLAEIDDDVEVVAYCRGPTCLLARDAVRLLEARGIRARRLEDGVVDWLARGLPVVAGASA